ncbi:MAG: hypothetical protein FJ386_10010 [Verrucomicrobia bacterium]|nr:hypothetical protein [Verrucomicrobiota bacterium]
MQPVPDSTTRVLRWAFAYAVWALVVGLFTAQLVFAGGFAWDQAFQTALRDWLPWALLGPVVVGLAAKFPLEAGRWQASLPVHLAACVAAVFACEFIGAQLPPPEQPNRPGSPGAGQMQPPFRRGATNPPPNFRRDPREPMPQPGAPKQPGRFDGGERNGPPEPRGDGQDPQPPRREFNNPPGPQAREPFNRDTDGKMVRGGRPQPNPAFNPPVPREGFVPPASASERLFGQPRDPAPPPPSPARAAAMRARIHVPIYWVIVCLAHAVAYHRRGEERQRRSAELEASLSQARLQALQAQLQPHFLFNTLNAAATLVHKDPRAADEMITNLSELLRLALDGSAQQEVPLRREFELLDRYLEIQQVRFGARLKVERELDAAALDARVPTLILQPLVENAIKHGIEPRAAAGVVGISARREGPVLRIVVRDTGGGLAPPHQPRDREGIGLANTRARIEALYGSAGRVTLRNGAEGGFSVEMEMPFRA